MKTLVIGQLWPWPARNGAALRLAGVVEASSRLGPVTFICLGPSGDEMPVAIQSVALPQVHPLEERTQRRSHALSRVFRKAFQPHVLRRSWNWEETGLDLSTFGLIWCSRPEAYFALLDAKPTASNVICDLDDLETQKLGQQLKAGLKQRFGSRPVGHMRFSHAVKEYIRWKLVYRSLINAAAGLTVASNDPLANRARDGLSVLENFFSLPDESKALSYSGKFICLFGNFEYGPNRSALERLLKGVMPTIWSVYPGLTVHIVGRLIPQVTEADMFRDKRILITGEVDSVGPYIDGASALVLPMSLGSGSRIKILEAWARRIPVVATTAGLSGLTFVPGVHALVGETDIEIAAQTLRVLRDSGVSSAMRANGQELWQRRYTFDIFAETIEVLARGKGNLRGEG